MKTDEELAQRDLKQGMKFLRTLEIDDLKRLLLLNNVDHLGTLTQLKRPVAERPKGLRSVRALKRERARILTLLHQQQTQ